MKVFHYEMFKPTPKTAAIGFALFIVPLAALYGMITWERVGLFATLADYAC